MHSQSWWHQKSSVAINTWQSFSCLVLAGVVSVATSGWLMYRGCEVPTEMSRAAVYGSTSTTHTHTHEQSQCIATRLPFFDCVPSIPRWACRSLVMISCLVLRKLPEPR
ncbi:hypothetical protein QBC41DRAFT_317877 [Cercophora samala]|uniref:Uncharacterized protein n=1 Tax=Cercophora samala TaxID=330535 RepID=A0AA39ZGB3_9PEZI|nr:hypothetical protein QBC41DRAFT_317877 [Cercophora samala]